MTSIVYEISSDSIISVLLRYMRKVCGIKQSPGPLLPKSFRVFHSSHIYEIFCQQLEEPGRTALENFVSNFWVNGLLMLWLVSLWKSCYIIDSNKWQNIRLQAADAESEICVLFLCVNLDGIPKCNLLAEYIRSLRASPSFCWYQAKQWLMLWFALQLRVTLSHRCRQGWWCLGHLDVTSHVWD